MFEFKCSTLTPFSESDLETVKYIDIAKQAVGSPIDVALSQKW